MAILKNMWLKGAKKRLGGTVIYQAMGQTRQRELASEVSNPRTQSQMGQRVKWSNLVNLYRVNRSWMKYAFETKKTNQSEYNKFMSLNVAESQIYLPKNVANAGGCIVDSYLITQGSLPSIEQVQVAGGEWQTNILLEDNWQFSDPTVAEFSQMVIGKNPGIRQGDQLSFIRLTQQTNSDTGVPYVVVREYELILDINGTGLVSDYIPAEYFSSLGSASDNRLTVVNRGNAGGWALILSRTISGKTYVSTQRIVVANNSSLISAYSSSAALQAAINSYGSSEDAFLSSIYASQDYQQITANSIVSIRMGTYTFIPGERYYRLPDLGSEDWYITMSNRPSVAPSLITVNAKKNGNLVTESLNSERLSIVGNEVKVTVIGDWDIFEEATLSSVELTIGGVIYRATFDDSEINLE